MNQPTLHLICNAHLDPVWQWRWEEGCSEALSTFGNAVDILREHPDLIFNHNEAILYQWVREHDKPMFKEIQRLVRAGRWHISGGWFLQPDVNLPDIESLIRQIALGRRFFLEHFNVHPQVAYNFDSFGHGGGLPQVLRQAGYNMYVHMRPQESELKLPSDLYRWRGVDGTEILAYRIAVGLYHTERDNIEQRLQEGTELALRLNRDVPVFWGIGNHGGGPTHEDLEIIDLFIGREKRVRVVHSTTDTLYESLKKFAHQTPVVEGDLQRVFTGCYTSLSRLKRRAHRSLSELTQAEALLAMSWWQRRRKYPDAELDEAWRDHLFNDFHDILPGSCTELAEQDALDQYGKVSETLRRLRLRAITSFRKGPARKLYVPVTVVTTNSALTSVPVETECMLDLRPKWTGTWHLKLFTLDGKEVTCQEEQPESLLPFNGWRRKVSFIAEVPQFGFRHYELRIVEGKSENQSVKPAISCTINPSWGLIDSLKTPGGNEILNGLLLKALVVDDDGDAWGANRWSYRSLVGHFEPVAQKQSVLSDGPVRRITESVFSYGMSQIIFKTVFYPDWPVLEYQLRVHWNETRKRLKLSIPTRLTDDKILCDVPGGAIERPADGDEHVHGRWCMIRGVLNGEKAAIGVVNSGQHGFDFKDGELRLSVLRSAAYCHEQGFAIGAPPSRKYMDQGVHEFRMLIVVGNPKELSLKLSGLAEWLSAPPLVLSHLPIGKQTPELDSLKLYPASIRVLAIKRSWDGKALIVRMQETTGEHTRARLSMEGLSGPAILSFRPFEIKSLRIDRNGKCRAVDLIEDR
jgi:alpha-mannosidase